MFKLSGKKDIYGKARNMHGKWNGQQAKFMEEFPYVYYVHCFAHHLQISLAAASKEFTIFCVIINKASK